MSARRWRRLVATASVGIGVLSSPRTATAGVFDTDDRVRVDPTTSAPFRQIGALYYGESFDSILCSAWLFESDAVATAGHCLGDGGVGGYLLDGVAINADDIAYLPALNGDPSTPSSKPYGFCLGEQRESHSNWRINGDSNFDFGAVDLDCSIGSTTGWFSTQNNPPAGLGVTVDGYPLGTPYPTGWAEGYQYKHSCSLLTAQPPTTYKIFYWCDTTGGQSGGPVIRTSDSKAVGIHTTYEVYFNSATKMRSYVKTKLTEYVA